MSMLSNSIRPAEHSVLTVQHEDTPAMHKEFKLCGMCARCNIKTYSITYSGHPVFKMVCPDCKTYLTVLKQKAKDRNKEIRLAQLANKK